MKLFNFFVILLTFLISNVLLYYKNDPYNGYNNYNNKNCYHEQNYYTKYYPESTTKKIDPYGNLLIKKYLSFT